MEKVGIVKTTIGSLKQEPGFEKELADETLFGRTVKILEENEEGWYFVETDYRYKGYIHESQLLIDESCSKWDEEANHIFNWGIGDAMAEPRYQSFPILQLTRGAIINFTGKEKEEWVVIEIPNGKIGWIRRDFVGERTRTRQGQNEKLLRKRVVETALTYLGTQYRWGGKSTLGIDCSGLCSITYLINGIIIYRDSQIKEEFGMKRISKEEIQLGYLLYYPGHVAMYIGNDKYIHATGKSSGVVINSLNPEDEDYREDLANIKEIATVF